MCCYSQATIEKPVAVDCRNQVLLEYRKHFIIVLMSALPASEEADIFL
jgi:hypothetical protein